MIAGVAVDKTARSRNSKKYANVTDVRTIVRAGPVGYSYSASSFGERDSMPSAFSDEPTGRSRVPAFSSDIVKC